MYTSLFLSQFFILDMKKINKSTLLKKYET